MLERMDDYEVRWREVKRYRDLLLFAFVGYVPFTIGLGLLADKLFKSDKFVFVFGVAWVLFFVFA